MTFTHTTFNSVLSHFSHISESHALHLITKMKILRFLPDPMNFFAISDSLSLVDPMYCHIINSSFLHGTFLADKQAIVLPMPKKTSLDPNLLKNYRPVTLLSYSPRF